MDGGMDLIPGDGRCVMVVGLVIVMIQVADMKRGLRRSPPLWLT